MGKEKTTKMKTNKIIIEVPSDMPSETLYALLEDIKYDAEILLSEWPTAKIEIQ